MEEMGYLIGNKTIYLFLSQHFYCPKARDYYGFPFVISDKGASQQKNKRELRL
jgi:hypothetical protein